MTAKSWINTNYPTVGQCAVAVSTNLNETRDLYLSLNVKRPDVGITDFIRRLIVDFFAKSRGKKVAAALVCLVCLYPPCASD